MIITILGQLGGGTNAGGGLGAGSLSQPPGIHPAWLAIPILVSLITIALCCWLMWRVRTVVRAVHELNSDSDKPVQVPGPLGFLRFKLRTLIILLTVVAIPLGMFMTEFRRAQKQGAVMEKLQVNEAVGASADAHYRLGMLGDSKLAALLGDWVHPHFGCRVDSLTLSYFEQTGGLWGLAVPSEIEDWQQIELLEKLPNLEVLTIDNTIIFEEDLERLAKLRKLRKLQLLDCQLSAGALQHLLNHGKLEHLEILKCKMRDEDLSGLETNSQLVHLDLSWNDLTGETLAELTKLESLESLILAQNPLTSDEVSRLSELAELKSLDVARTKLVAKQLKPVVLFPALQRLRISTMGLIDPILKMKGEDLRIIYADSDEEPAQWVFSDNRPTVKDEGFGNGINGGFSGSMF